jgi:RpiB/LacA/LacB family sugar-phosphate isomerase
VRIGIGSDQSGSECKERLKARLTRQGHAIEDVSTGDQPRSDYQSITTELSSAIYTGRVERGVLICSRAIGACVMANKHPGVRAALSHDLNSVREGVQDDGMNLLVMGGYGLTPDWACEVASVFINSTYSPGEKPFGIPPRRLARIVEHIRKNLDKPLGVGALSSLAEMSQSHFSKMFKLSTGLAPHQFVLQERINRSKELLRHDDAKIVEVALEVGFENQAHFTTVFGNLVGMTPRQFQRSADYEPPVMYGPPVEAAQSWREHTYEGR